MLVERSASSTFNQSQQRVSKNQPAIGGPTSSRLSVGRSSFLVWVILSGLRGMKLVRLVATLSKGMAQKCPSRLTFLHFVGNSQFMPCINFVVLGTLSVRRMLFTTPEQPEVGLPEYQCCYCHIPYSHTVL